MIECDDDFELNLSFGGGDSGAAKKKPKETRQAPPAREKASLRRHVDPAAASATSPRPSTAPSSYTSSSSSSTVSGGSGRSLSAKSLRRVDSTPAGKLNTTTGLVQHKVPVIGNKVKRPTTAVTTLSKSKPTKVSTEKDDEQSPADGGGGKSKEQQREDDPMQYHARPKDLSKDAGPIKETARSEYIFTRQSFASLKMPVKVVELLEKDVVNGK
jgi:hypothetical protein